NLRLELLSVMVTISACARRGPSSKIVATSRIALMRFSSDGARGPNARVGPSYAFVGACRSGCNLLTTHQSRLTPFGLPAEQDDGTARIGDVVIARIQQHFPPGVGEVLPARQAGVDDPAPAFSVPRSGKRYPLGFVVCIEDQEQ